MSSDLVSPPIFIKSINDPRTINIFGKDITFEAVAPGSYEEILLYFCLITYFPYTLLGLFPYFIDYYSDIADSWTIEMTNYIITCLVQALTDLFFIIPSALISYARSNIKWPIDDLEHESTL